MDKTTKEALVSAIETIKKHCEEAGSCPNCELYCGLDDKVEICKLNLELPFSWSKEWVKDENTGT